MLRLGHFILIFFCHLVEQFSFFQCHLYFYNKHAYTAGILHVLALSAIESAARFESLLLQENLRTV